MGWAGLRHNGKMEEMRRIKKPPLFWAASSLSFSILSGAFGFGEPPMCIRVHGQNGQDDGNKGDKGDVEHRERE
jgi:hypothetical protein